MSAIVDTPRELTPGALEVYDQRDVPGVGLVEFEFAPAGWLTKKGEPRQRDWRAYYLTPSDGKRTRLPSVSTVLDAILPKPGLPPWAEARGIEGAVRAIQAGHLLAECDPAEAVAAVRRHKLGADRARDEAASRGISVHDLLREFMETGSPPRLADHPVEYHGYIAGLSKWLIHAKPEPVAVEEMVVNPEQGYAGRTDLVATVGGSRTRYDLKTQERCGIYESAHVQVKLYDRAARSCGDEPADLLKVVVVAADGEYREMACAADDATVDAALAWWRLVRPITSVCESANRAERKARA